MICMCQVLSAYALNAQVDANRKEGIYVAQDNIFIYCKATGIQYFGLELCFQSQKGPGSRASNWENIERNSQVVYGHRIL